MVKFLVTGGAGFIDSNIVRNLIEIGSCVRVVDNMATGKFLNKKINFMFGAHQTIE